MVEIKTTRSYRVEGDDFIAVKTDEYVNGIGKHVVRTLEEHNISREDIENVLNKETSEELVKLDEERKKQQHELDNLREEYGATLDSPEFADFVEFIRKEDTKKFFSALKAQTLIEKAEAQLKEFENTQIDILNWKVQFEGLKSSLPSLPEESVRVDFE
jgi:seryl-tRNA synthetase